MEQLDTPTTKRIVSIDILRGIVMVIMALDHVRDFFHFSANTADPLAIDGYDLPLFFTRWITHFCAPIFVLLSGVSIYLQSQRKPLRELAIFSIKRGAWLVFAEWTIIGFAWTFNPYFSVFPFQVIWAIGISMILLGLLLLARTPYKAILALGLLIVLGHNALDPQEAAQGFAPGFWWDLFHTGVFRFHPIGESHSALLVYPFLPWTGLMFLGYGLGRLFEPRVTAAERTRKLRLAGVFLLLLFVVLRWADGYGDPARWTVQPTLVQTFLSFIKVTKYPPSLMFMSLTIGCGLLALSYLEHVHGRFARMMTTYGRTAFFYYIAHLYVIHLIAVAFFYLHGHTLSEVWNIGRNFPFLFVVPGEGEGLAMVYVIWAVVVLVHYPLCRWYDQYKTRHKEKWWLSYL